MFDKNILVTTIGAHSCNTVIRSLRSFFPNKIYGCDIYPAEWASASLLFDDTFVAPYASEESKYLEFLINLCARESIGLILPLLDFVVDFFNKYRCEFAAIGVVLAINNKLFVDIARDKEKVSQIKLSHSQYGRICTYKLDELTPDVKYPLLAKKKNGRGSKGQYILNSIQDINTAIDSSNYIFQQFIAGPIIAIDYIRCAYTQESFAVARKELRRTPNGAGMTVEIFKDDSLLKILDEFGELFDINGTVNLEFILNNNHYYLIDINPRFSTGIGFSNLTGYDFIKNHILAFTHRYIESPVVYPNFIADKRMIETITKIKKL